MASINISAERVVQVESSIRRLVTSFVKPIDSMDDYTSTFHPDVEWYDHAFLVRRVGHVAVAGLHESFTYANQPFDVEIKNIIPTTTGAILEKVWVGRLSNDITRPNGQVVVKASGKDFKCHVCMVIEIDEAGKIRKIDEYYNKNWDHGIRQDQYSIIKGASLKPKA